MNCAYHTKNTASVNCQSCGRGLCPACDHRIRGFAYCQDCIVNGISLLQNQSSAQTPSYFATQARVSPFLATVLSLVFPGLGAAYLGKTVKALTHFALFTGLFQMAIMTRGTAVFVLGFMAAWLFSAIDTWRTAKSDGKNLSVLEESLTHKLNVHPLSWGIIFVIFGIVLFLPIPLGLKLFPILLVGLGVYLLIGHFRAEKKIETSNYNFTNPDNSSNQKQISAYSNVSEFRPNNFTDQSTRSSSARPTTRFGNRS